MNVRQKCPCGQEFEITHISLKHTEGLDPVWERLEEWCAEHRPHHEAALKAHVDNLATRTAPTIHNHFVDEPPDPRRAERRDGSSHGI